MEKLRVIGLFGCLIINNYAIEESKPPTYLFEKPQSPDLKAFKALSNLPIGYTPEGLPVYDFLPENHFFQIFSPSSSEQTGDVSLSDRKNDLSVPLAESPDWLDVASLFVAQQGDFSQRDSSKRVVPANFAEITASGAQEQPEQSRFAVFFKELEDRRTEQLGAAFYQQANTLAPQPRATSPQLTESRFAGFFRQKDQQEPARTIQTAAALLPGLNPQAQVFTPNPHREPDKRAREDQKGKVDLFSPQGTPGTLYQRRCMNIEPLVLQPSSIPIRYISLPVVYPPLLLVPIVDQQILSRNAEMENMKDRYYYEKNFSNNRQIHCCRPDCTQGGQVYSGHALIFHYPGLAFYLQRNRLPIN